MMTDAVREYLRGVGVRRDVAEGGLSGLVSSWETIVRQLDGVYTLTIDDYRNDLDIRDLIAKVVPIAKPAEREAVAGRLAAADQHFRNATQAGDSVWGDPPDSSDATDAWWTFRWPQRAGEAFATTTESEE